MKQVTSWSDWYPLPKWTFQTRKDKRLRLFQPQCQVYFWIVYIHIYLKCACLNLYWVHIGPPWLQACVVLSPCWRHETLYQTQSQRHYWNVDWLIALYLHHFWCFYSCTTHLLFFSFFWFFNSPCLILFECMNIFGRNVTERMSREKESTFFYFFILVHNLCVCSCVLSVMIGF